MALGTGKGIDDLRLVWCMYGILSCLLTKDVGKKAKKVYSSNFETVEKGLSVFVLYILGKL